MENGKKKILLLVFSLKREKIKKSQKSENKVLTIKFTYATISVSVEEDLTLLEKERGKEYDVYYIRFNT